MRKIVIASIALSLVLSPAAFAEGLLTFANFYVDPDFDCTYGNVGSLKTISLGLWDPVNPDFAGTGPREVQNVGGFECKLVPFTGVIIVGWDFPVPATVLNVQGGVAVGFSEPVPVVQGVKNDLASVTLLLTDVGYPLEPEPVARCTFEVDTGIGIEPIYNGSVPGSVCFLDADDPDDPVVAAEVRDVEKDFKINLQAAVVATEPNTWGGIKALYR